MCAEPFGTISRHTDRHTAWNRWAASCYYYCGRGFCACAVPQGFPYSRSVVYTCSRPNSFLIQQRTPDNRINNPVAYDTCLALYVHIYVSSICVFGFLFAFRYCAGHYPLRMKNLVFYRTITPKGIGRMLYTLHSEWCKLYCLFPGLQA